MKRVVAIIKPFKLDEVREALAGIGVEGITVTEVKGCGRQNGQSEIYRGDEDGVSLLPKIMLEVVAPDGAAETVADTIARHAATGRIGDGKIFFVEVAQAVRIRTGERDGAAL
ncbi:MAG TPA: P-II family nitrogen regulator [Alphaproteobacteria bacterium]|nr:P-II family nitrogen regulator [Alphaproteobacteria bacterium]